MNDDVERCKCGMPFQWWDARVGWYWCDHCDRPEQDPRYVPLPR